MLKTKPYSWLRQLPTSLLQLDEIPLFGPSPAFPLENLATQLASTFKLDSFALETLEMRWLESEHILEGMSNELIPFHFAIAPVAGNVCWLISKPDLDLLIALILRKKTEPFHALEPDFEQGFTHFLVLEVVNCLRKAGFDSNLSPQLVDNQELPQGPAFCIDIAIHIAGLTLQSRLIVPKEFQTSWKDHYNKQGFQDALTNSLAQNLQLTVHLEAGRTKIMQSQWLQVKAGDFLILDFCSLEPDAKKGRVLLTIHNTAFFRAKVKDGNIKILENPLYHEADTPMDKKLTEDEDWEHEEQSEEESDFDFDDEDFEESDFEESEVEESQTDEESLVEHEHDEDEPEEVSAEFSTEEEVSEIESEEEPEASGVAPPPAATPAHAEKKTITKPEKIQDVPLSIVVEVGRIHMSVQQLLDLQPGNLLELNVQPENGVDLVANGRWVARGELLQIGESLGVRILETT